MEIRKRKNLIAILRIAISVALLVVLIRFADVDKIFQSLSNFKITILPVVFGLITVSVIISSLKWGVLLNSNNILKDGTPLFRIYSTALFFNNFLPSSIGGDGVRILLAAKRYGNASAAAASVVIDRAVASVSLALLGLVSALFSTNPSLAALWLLTALFVFGILASAVLLTGWVPGFIRKGKGKIRTSWISFAGSLGDLKEKPGALAVNFILALLFQISAALVVGSVMWGLGNRIPGLPDLFFITSASSVLAMVPLGLNGYGLREGAYIMLLEPFGYSISSALTVSVLFAVFVSIFSIIGGINWAITGLRSGQNLKEGVSS